MTDLTPADLAGELDRLDKAATVKPWRPEDVYPLVAPTKIDGIAFPAAREADAAQREADNALVSWLRNHTDEIKAALAYDGRIHARASEWRDRAEQAEAERDRLRATVQRVEALADECTVWLGDGRVVEVERTRLDAALAGDDGGEQPETCELCAEQPGISGRDDWPLCRGHWNWWLETYLGRADAPAPRAHLITNGERRVYRPDWTIPPKPAAQPEAVDLVGALKASIEAARARRQAQQQPEPFDMSPEEITEFLAPLEDPTGGDHRG